MQSIKAIGKNYRVLRPLFQINSYLYAQVCSKKDNYNILTAALYVFENEDPSQCLKMLREKLGIEDFQELAYLIFPYCHVKQTFNDKNISLFLINHYILPLKNCRIKEFTTSQFLQLLHGGLSSLNLLHNREVIHGNIKMKTSYMARSKKDNHCKFAFNILDTNYFTQEDCFSDIQDKLFQSQGQSLGQTISFKDDLQSLVYVMTHLISKGKLFTVQRFQLEWITQSQFLRWKNCQFFKEMIHIVPSQLEILIEIYTIAKTLRRNQKPDYLKLIKKVLNIISSVNKKARHNAQRCIEMTLEKAVDIANSRNQDDIGPTSIKLMKKEDIILEVQDSNVSDSTTRKEKRKKDRSSKEVQFKV